MTRMRVVIAAVVVVAVVAVAAVAVALLSRPPAPPSAAPQAPAAPADERVVVVGEAGPLAGRWSDPDGRASFAPPEGWRIEQLAAGGDGPWMGTVDVFGPDGGRVLYVVEPGSAVSSTLEVSYDGSYEPILDAVVATTEQGLEVAVVRAPLTNRDGGDEGVEATVMLRDGASGLVLCDADVCRTALGLARTFASTEEADAWLASDEAATIVASLASFRLDG